MNKPAPAMNFIMELVLIYLLTPFSLNSCISEFRGQALFVPHILETFGSCPTDFANAQYPACGVADAAGAQFDLDIHRQNVQQSEQPVHGKAGDAAVHQFGDVGNFGELRGQST